VIVKTRDIAVISNEQRDVSGEMMDRQDWNLIVIGAAKGMTLSPVQLQKALFLLGETLPSINKDDFYRFKPYNYGPFSKEIYSDAEVLAASGLITIAAESGQSWASYRATQHGIRKSDELLATLDDSEKKYITKLVQWIRNLTFEQLLAHVYSKYSDYAKNSMFRVQH